MSVNRDGSWHDQQGHGFDSVETYENLTPTVFCQLILFAIFLSFLFLLFEVLLILIVKFICIEIKPIKQHISCIDQ